MGSIEQGLEEAQHCVAAIRTSPFLRSSIDAFVQTLVACFAGNNKVLLCGNGGSAADAMHAAEELTGRFHKDRPALPAIALTDPTHITCVGNDYGFDAVFSRAIEAYGRPGDVCICLTTSGNSDNIIRAHQAAKQAHLKTVVLTGKEGGKLAGLADIELLVPGSTTARIQEMHMMILHLVIEAVETQLFFSEASL